MSILYPKMSKRILSSHKISEKYNEQTVFHKKAVLKNFVIFTGKTCVGISFLIKMLAFRHEALLKSDSNSGVFFEYWEIFNNTYFEEHLWTAASESFTWTFSYMNKWHRKWRRRFLKNKTKQNKTKKPF